MNNAFYHEFEIGFNAYMVVAPVMLGMAAIFATQQAFLTPGLKIRKIFGDGILKLVTLVCGMVFAAMFASESWQGIIQWCDNHLAGDSGMYSLILMPMVIAAISALYGGCVYAVMKIAVWARLGHLTERRRIERRRRKMKLLEEVMDALRRDRVLELEKQYQEEVKKQAEEGARLEADTVLFRLKRPEKPVFKVVTN